MRHPLSWFIYIGLFCFSIASINIARAQDEGMEYEQTLAQLEQQLAELRQNKADLDQQYENLAGSRLLHRVLLEQRASLPRFTITDLNDVLAEHRLALFYLQRQLRQAEEANLPTEQLRLEKERLEATIETLVTLMDTQRQLSVATQNFAAQLEEYLFWTPSEPPINRDWWLALPQRTEQQLARIQSATSAMLRNVSLQWNGYVLFLLIALGLLAWKRPYFKQSLKTYESEVRNTETQASPWLVPIALTKMALYVLPGTIALLALGQFFHAPSDAEHLNPGAAFTALAFAWFMLSFLHKLTNPNGFAHHYFNWPKETCARLRKFLWLLGCMLLPLTFVLAFAIQQTTLYAEDVLGSLSLLLASLYLLGIIIWLFVKLPPLYASLYVHRAIAGAFLILPISLMLMVFNGYYYTALKLSGYYLATFYVLSAWVILEASIHRSIQLSTERLRVQQAEERARALAELEAAGDTEQSKEIPEPEVDPEQAYQQAIRLGRFVLLVVFTFVLFTVWSDATVALQYLDTQFIWQPSDDVGVFPVSLGALLTAAFITIVSVILVRNLPGLLEMLVLSRLNLEMGTSYAVTSLLNYVLVGIAVVAIFGTLGMQWSQLQWLAAGLTVGLGFGLQAIFANFVSGLILFFERPVRVGDIVTLDNLSGRVSKIRIRATVITDFDRRDIVVPNQNFITSKFVNWSLSNTVTRITIKVGVAYGSNLEKTREILLDIADKESRIQKDPPPQALFLSFGESTLDHELRVHVGALKDRNPTIDAVNREIDRRFREAGIEIAFNQIDVHFRNELGIEKLIERREPPQGSPQKSD